MLGSIIFSKTDILFLYNLFLFTWQTEVMQIYFADTAKCLFWWALRSHKVGKLVAADSWGKIKAPLLSCGSRLLTSSLPPSLQEYRCWSAEKVHVFVGLVAKYVKSVNHILCSRKAGLSPPFECVFNVSLICESRLFFRPRSINFVSSLSGSKSSVAFGDSRFWFPLFLGKDQIFSPVFSQTF